MDRIPKKQREFVEEHAQWFVEEIQHAKQDTIVEELPTIRVRLADFRGDLALLYACLWYASGETVKVTFVP